MEKDVIYIDVDDDVTAIIGKIKKAKQKVVAIVPPKRSGTLQSAVNLRLLDRMARADKKRLVLITNNQALIALSANANIPVAKNLQSKPEVAEVTALTIDDNDDIIDGSQLPVGDHAKGIPVKDNTTSRSDAIETIDIESEAPSSRTARSADAKKGGSKSKTKIPNFDSFRKRLFIGIGAGVALTVLFVWMFVFAPAATVIITAITNPAPVSSTVQLGTTEATSFEDGIIKSVTQELENTESIEFDATGEKDLGEKAAGVVTFSTVLLTSLGTIPAGTELTSTSGKVYVTDEPATLDYPGSTVVSVGITAVAPGTSYNGAIGPVSGAPSGVTAEITEATSGGTTKVVKVVQNSDVERARGELIGRSTDDQKASLAALFANEEKVIESSFTITRDTQVVSPKVGAEASSGSATLTIPTTYTMYALPKAELEKYLKASLEDQLDTPDVQEIYSTGIDDAGLSNFKKEDDTITVAVTATGRIGPKIDDAVVKEQVKGKIYGEVQQSLESIDGVKEVDVQFSYFWVRTIPNAIDKITIEFKLENE